MPRPSHHKAAAPRRTSGSGGASSRRPLPGGPVEHKVLMRIRTGRQRREKQVVGECRALLVREHERDEISRTLIRPVSLSDLEELRVLLRGRDLVDTAIGAGQDPQVGFRESHAVRAAHARDAQARLAASGANDCPVADKRVARHVQPDPAASARCPPPSRRRRGRVRGPSKPAPAPKVRNPSRTWYCTGERTLCP